MFNIYFHGSRRKKKIALTFDDGPSKETEKVLDLLKKYNTKATFFIWGERIKGREKTIERIKKEGHEFGNHTFSHKRMWFKSREFMKKYIQKCDDELNKFGIKTNLFRPPCLAIGINLLVVCEKGKRKIIACDVISNDWKKLGVDKISNRVLRKTKNGSILNFHDYIEGIGPNKDLPRILEEVLPILKAKYKFILVSDLIK